LRHAPDLCRPFSPLFPGHKNKGPLGHCRKKLSGLPVGTFQRSFGIDRFTQRALSYGLSPALAVRHCSPGSRRARYKFPFGGPPKYLPPFLVGRLPHLLRGTENSRNRSPHPLSVFFLFFSLACLVSRKNLSSVTSKSRRPPPPLHLQTSSFLRKAEKPSYAPYLIVPPISMVLSFTFNVPLGNEFTLPLFLLPPPSIMIPSHRSSLSVSSLPTEVSLFQLLFPSPPDPKSLFSRPLVSIF